jgi:hypothetical protein
VDDLIAFLRGQDSVIGAILNGWFGDGTADVVRAWALDAIAACKSLVVGGLDLIRLGLNDDASAVERLEAKFMASSQAIGDAVQAVIDKVFFLKDAFSLENLHQGANELLDMLSSDADANQRRKERRDAAAMKDNAKSGEQLLREGGRYVSPAGPFSAKQSVSDLLGGVRGNTGFAPTSAPITNTTNSASTTNNFPVKVDVTIKGSATAKDVSAGVAAGLNDYRAAVQNLEQRRAP